MKEGDMEEGQKVVNVHCTCGIRVAAGDPEKVEKDGRRFHRKCFRVLPDLVRAQPQYREQGAFSFVN